MKNLVIAAIASLPFLFAACTTDSYDKGEGDYSLMRADLADVQVDSEKRAVAAVTDEGVPLTFSNPFKTGWIQKGDTTYRAYLYYTPDAESAFKVVSAGQVLVLRPRRESEPMTDPVGFESLWLSTDRRYLNASLLLKVGQGDDDKAYHVLGATIDSLVRHADNTRTLHLHLYHDQGAVPQYYTQRTYVSIPTALTDADSIHFRVNTYDGWRERTIAIK